MPTTFTIDHDRQWTDSEVAAVIARGTATTNVMDVAGADAQGLPGVEMAQYQTDTDDLEDQGRRAQGQAGRDPGALARPG